MSTFSIVLTIIAAALFGAFVLLGAWIDGRRQALRNKGLHPVTTPEGNVTAQEFQEIEHGSSRTGHDTPPQRIR